MDVLKGCFHSVYLLFIFYGIIKFQNLEGLLLHLSFYLSCLGAWAIECVFFPPQLGEAVGYYSMKLSF